MWLYSIGSGKAFNLDHLDAIEAIFKNKQLQLHWATGKYNSEPVAAHHFLWHLMQAVHRATPNAVITWEDVKIQTEQCKACPGLEQQRNEA